MDKSSELEQAQETLKLLESKNENIRRMVRETLKGGFHGSAHVQAMK